MVKRNLQFNCLKTLMMLLIVSLFASGIVYAEEELTADALLAQCNDKYAQAEDLWKLKNYSEAKSLYQYVSQNSSDSDLTMKSKARGASCDIQLDNYSAAEQAIAALKKDYSTYDGLCTELYSPADEYWNKGKYGEAKALGEYIAQNSSDSDLVMKCRVWVAACDIHLGNDSAAEQAFEVLKNDYFQNNKLYRELFSVAHEYLDIGKYDKAKALFQDVAQNSSDSNLAIRGLAGIAGCDIRLGNDIAAQQAIEALWSKYSSTEEFGRGIRSILAAYKKAGRYAASQALFDRLVTELPNDPYIPLILSDEIRSCLKSGDTEGADEKAEELLKHNQSVDSFMTAANRAIAAYGNINDSSKVLELFGRVLAMYPNHDQSLPIYARFAKVKAYTQGAADTSEVDTIVQLLMTDYKDAETLGLHIFQIGEEYYLRAEEAMKNGDPEQAQANFQRAISVWGKNITEINDSKHKCFAYYFSAIACQYLKDHQKAVKYFEEVVKGWPDYDRRWHALSGLAMLYEKQLLVNELSKEAATLKIKNVYQEIIQKYPDAPSTQAAEIWLKAN